MVHGNGNYAAVGASEEGGDPGGRVRAPEHNAIAFANSAGSQFASETEGGLSDLAIAVPGYAIATALGVGLFAAKTLEIQSDTLASADYRKVLIEELGTAVVLSAMTRAEEAVR